MSLGCTDYPWTLYLTGGHSSPPCFGKIFAGLLVLLQVCRQGFILKLMAKQSAPTKSWRWHYAAWSLRMLPLGVNGCLGLNMHISLPSSSTGLSPFQCCLGYQPPLFPTQEEEVAVPSVQAFVRRCRRVWARTRHHLLQAGKKYKKMADRRRVPAPAYRPGHRVMLSTANLPLKVLSRKLAPRFVGPFPVSKIINPCTVKLSLPLSMRRIHPSFHVSQLRPLISCPLSPPVKAPPPPTVIDGGETYMVRRLLKVRCRGRGLQYLVDWKGYGPEERCWVPSRFVLDHRLIEDFHRQNPEAPIRAPRGVLSRSEPDPCFLCHVPHVLCVCALSLSPSLSPLQVCHA